MQNNLKTIRYNDGSSIPNVTESEAWGNLTTPGYCWYQNDEPTYKDPFGALYNWYTVSTGKLCPTGWHVPAAGEWTILSDYLGGESVAGGKLYGGAQDIYWGHIAHGADNASGFTAVPGGIRSGHISPGDELGVNCYLWSSTEYDANNARVRGLNCDRIDFVTFPLIKADGISVRCIKNNIDLTIVTNVNDNGSGSLRNAIEYANSTTGVKETIEFNIPGSGTHTIQPLNALPAITDPVIIDGFTQPGASASDGIPIIELDGTNAGSGSDGLKIKCDNSLIRGLIINRFKGAGILIDNNSEGNIIAGNYIGTDKNGTVEMGNTGTGISVQFARNNKIGGLTIGDRNIISGNGTGIFLNESGGSTVIGNFIGVDASGTKPLGNKSYGINVSEDGGNIIGEASPGGRNIISSNGDGGIILVYGAPANVIKGNYIGVDVSGQVSLGNSGPGIIIFNSVRNIIGGTGTGEGNLISGNLEAGIELYSSGTVDNNILGNFIGTDNSGEKPIGNLIGINIHGGANSNQIGNDNEEGQNIIANSKEEGILISDNNSTKNNILINSIHSNGKLGINLVGGTEDPKE